MQSKRSVAVALIILFLLPFVQGCKKDFEEVAYNSLESMLIIYDTSMSIMGDLYKKQMINEATKDKIIQAGNVFKESYDVAVVALATYKATEGAEGTDKIFSAMTSALSHYDELLDLINAARGSPIPDSAVPNREYLEEEMNGG